MPASGPLQPGDYRIDIKRLRVSQEGALSLVCRCSAVRGGAAFELELQAQVHQVFDPLFEDRAQYLLLKYGGSDDLVEFIGHAAVDSLTPDAYESWLAQQAYEREREEHEGKPAASDEG